MPTPFETYITSIEKDLKGGKATEGSLPTALPLRFSWNHWRGELPPPMTRSTSNAARLILLWRRASQRG